MGFLFVELWGDMVEEEEQRGQQWKHAEFHASEHRRHSGDGDRSVNQVARNFGWGGTSSKAVGGRALRWLNNPSGIRECDESSVSVLFNFPESLWAVAMWVYYVNASSANCNQNSSFPHWHQRVSCCCSRAKTLSWPLWLLPLSFPKSWCSHRLWSVMK